MPNFQIKSPTMLKITKNKPKKKTTSLKKSLLAPLPPVRKTAKSPKIKTSTPDYYNCLLNYSQQGFYDAQVGKKLKIHACCKKCKQNAPVLNNQRDQELVKLITSYKQVGDSLAK